MTNTDKPRPFIPLHLVWTGLAVLVALGYLLGLGGDHIPRIGDELVYSHIAHLTAETGRWLPLVSSYDYMRNTKPPLLFWQAMVAGGWGEHWTLLRLRLPSLAYTWGIALMVGLLTCRIVRADAHQAQPGPPSTVTQERQRRHAVTMGAIAAMVYLSFFSTYSYGRPFLTSAAETFWLFGVFFALGWWPARLASHWKFPLLAGLAVGIACLYKSFVMVVPAGFALALCYQTVGARVAPWKLFRRGIAADGARVVLMCLLGLAVFSLWFAVDPQPGEVWREFVVGENAGKMTSADGYFKTAFSGSGIVTILRGYFSNAIPLLPLAVGCMVAAWRAWRQRRGTAQTVRDAEKIMWLWLLALALVFMLPTQRSARYLIPGMPALAVVMALYWHRIGRIWFSLTLALCLICLLPIGFVAFSALRATQNMWLYSPLFWFFMVASALGCLLGIFRKAWMRPTAALAGFALLFALAWFTQPFNGELGRFSAGTNELLKGQTVSAPDFEWPFERYRFVIPGARLVSRLPAQPAGAADAESLFKNSRYALIQRRIGQIPCTKCRIVDQRWDLLAQPDRTEGAMAAFKTPETYWFSREYLVERLEP